MTSLPTWLAVEFRYRIFFSLGIVLIACILSYGLYQDQRTVPEIFAGTTGRSAGFLIGAFFCSLATYLRMCSGTALRSGRIMSFEPRAESLIVRPPYNLVRNPIYLADLFAAVGFSFCMPLPGVLYPVMLAVHYVQLVRYEEKHLRLEHGPSYASYHATVPKLVPNAESIRAFLHTLPSCRPDKDGARFNALYLLFIPGLCLAALTGEFFHAVLIGLPAVADWAYWHTVKGLSPSYNGPHHAD